VLHNFICIHDPDDVPDEDIGDSEDLGDVRGRLQSHVTAEERSRAASHRDQIAKAMWADYEARGRRP
jgi:hypothetical protein